MQEYRQGHLSAACKEMRLFQVHIIPEICGTLEINNNRHMNTPVLLSSDYTYFC